MTEVISYAREKRPKALTPLYIVYVVSYTFNVYDQAGNMYTYNLYVVSCALFRPCPPSVALYLHARYVHITCTCALVFFGKYRLLLIQCINSHARYPTCSCALLCVGRVDKLLYVLIIRSFSSLGCSAYPVLRYALRAYYEL